MVDVVAEFDNKIGTKYNNTITSGKHTQSIQNQIMLRKNIKYKDKSLQHPV